MNLVNADAVKKAAQLATGKLHQANQEAVTRHEALRAVLTGFKLDLEYGESRRVLARSPW